LQQRVFDLVMQTQAGADPPASASKPSKARATASASGARAKASSKGSARQPKRVADLDLGHKSVPGSFDELVAQKTPKSNYEFNAVAVYYLQEKMHIGAINMDHVFTCYDHVNRKIPTAFEQSLRDTASQKGYIDVSDWDSIKLAPKGRNLVLHDLPAKSEAK
jgi:hypothetical protein